MNTDNIYATPASDVTVMTNESDSKNLIQSLRSQSTWKLLFLSIITLGIYGAHYMRNQTKSLNKQLSDDQQISNGLVLSILILSYITVALIIPFFVVLDENPQLDQLDQISANIDKVLSILILVWGFKARNRMNSLLGLSEGGLSVSKDDTKWFHGFWTFLFQYFYFNYKVNKISEDDKISN